MKKIIPTAILIAAFLAGAVSGVGHYAAAQGAGSARTVYVLAGGAGATEDPYGFSWG